MDDNALLPPVPMPTRADAEMLYSTMNDRNPIEFASPPPSVHTRSTGFLPTPHRTREGVEKHKLTVL